MKKIVKFSKTYNNIIQIKQSFFSNNNENLKNSLKINRFYKKNPNRTHCKNCLRKSLKKFLKSHLIEYYICKHCGHLNGKYKDTEKFAKNLYTKNSGKNYYKNYLNDYNQRVKKIYLPKVKFLKNVIKKKISLVDIGCGGGHFLKALETQKISAIGFEPSKILSNLGNKKLKRNKIINSNFDEIYKVLKSKKNFNTISMIGVLEHLTDPHKFLRSFKKSNAEYLYISVPLFSLSVFLENSFKSVFPRQLSGGHTHLYTKKSLEKLTKKYNLKVVGEWWFGTDFPDLYRSLINTGNFSDKNNYIKELNRVLFDQIDNLQNVLDKNKMCSEVHMILKN